MRLRETNGDQTNGGLMTLTKTHETQRDYWRLMETNGDS